MAGGRIRMSNNDAAGFTRIGRLSLLALLLWPALLAGAAQAQSQSVPPAPPTPTREELQPAQAEASRAPRARSHLKVEDRIERAPCPLAEPGYAKVMVTFSSVDFRNLQIAPSDALKESWAEFAGHEVPVARLCDVRDRAATMLRRWGYVAAIQIPPQRIEKGGVVRFDVLLAKLVSVRVRGKAGPSANLIAAHLNKLVDQPFFNSFAAERHLLLAGDLPGYDVRLILRPAGTVPGEVIGDVEVRRQPVEVAAAIQNYGSQAVGRIGGLVQLRLNDLLGLGDSSRISLYNTTQTREQTVLQLGEELNLGTSGLRLNGDFVYAWTRPDVVNRKFKAHTLTATTELGYPIVRKRQFTVMGAGGLDWIDQSLYFSAVRISADRLRVAFLRANVEALDLSSLSGALGYSSQEPKWRLNGQIELRKGLAGLGASADCGAIPAACKFPNTPTSRKTANPQGLVARAQAQFDYRPTPDWTLSLAPRAQISDSALLGFEQFSAGNYTIGRGFDPGTIQGDDGAGFSLEMRYGRLTPASSRDLALQPYVFYDSAWSWTKGPTTGPDHFHLHSIGGGLRTQWGGHGRADLTVAVPLDRAGFQTQTGDVRVLFSLSTQLIPW